MSMTDSLETSLLNAVLRNTSYTSPTTVYVALTSTAPTDSTAGTEITGNGYSRQSVTFSAPSSGICASNVAVSFSASGNAWATVAGTELYDASSGGNRLFWQALNTPVSVLAGETLTIDTGDMTVTAN